MKPGAGVPGAIGSELRVCHFVHAPQIGGVETAIAALQAERLDGLRYEVGVLDATRTIDDVVAIEHPDFVGSGLNSLLSWYRVARWAKGRRADIIVASLWRSVLAGVIAKVLYRRTIFVVFLHSTRYKNIADRMAHYVGLRVADAVFCDSMATQRSLLAATKHAHSAVVVPVISRHIDDASREEMRRDEMRLIYWGRMAPEKRIDRILDLTAELVATSPVPVALTVLGPDGGELQSLKMKAEQLGIAGSVTWLGPATWNSIAAEARGASFFVQTSEFEGFSMATVEAMQLGLIPVVTAVGQIASFAIDGKNSIHYASPVTTARRMIDLWLDEGSVRSLSRHAQESWRSTPGVGSAFNAACRQLAIDCRRVAAP